MNRLKNDKTKIAVASKIDVPQNYMNEIMSEEQWWLVQQKQQPPPPQTIIIEREVDSKTKYSQACESYTNTKIFAENGN